MLTEEDVFIRRRWLRASIINWIGVPVVLFLYALIIHFKVTPSLDFAIEALSILFRNCMFFAVIYFFAYRKFGVKYLKFALIVGPIVTLVSASKTLFASMDIWTVFFLSVEILPYIWWYTWSLKLKQVNEKKLAELTRPS